MKGTFHHTLVTSYRHCTMTILTGTNRGCELHLSGMQANYTTFLIYLAHHQLPDIASSHCSLKLDENGLHYLQFLRWWNSEEVRCLHCAKFTVLELLQASCSDYFPLFIPLCLLVEFLVLSPPLLGLAGITR